MLKKVVEKLMLRVSEPRRRYVPIVLATAGFLLIGASCPKPPPAPPPPDALDGSTPADDGSAADSPSVPLQDALEGLQDALVDVQHLLDAGACPVSDNTPCGLACTHMCKLGCEDGKMANCADVCNRVKSTPGMPKIDPACISKATTQAEVRKCPSIKCR